MAVVEKYRVEHAMKWKGTPYARGDALSRDMILSDTQVGESKLKTLLRLGWLVPDPGTRPLNKMSNADLVDHGRDMGADVHPNMVKKDLIAAIEGVL